VEDDGVKSQDAQVSLYTQNLSILISSPKRRGHRPEKPDHLAPPRTRCIAPSCGGERRQRSGREAEGVNPTAQEDAPIPLYLQ
jgi:hypothetical protein